MGMGSALCILCIVWPGLLKGGSVFLVLKSASGGGTQELWHHMDLESPRSAPTSFCNT